MENRARFTGTPHICISIPRQVKKQKQLSDAVNIAPRLENPNKKLGTGIIISSDVFMKLRDHTRYTIKKVGRVRIRGKENPVSVLEVIPE